jgi:hypothetical protein
MISIVLNSDRQFVADEGARLARATGMSPLF